MKLTHLWLRDETKPDEKRTALTPAAIKALLDAGMKVTVEESQNRAIPTNEYQTTGCEITPSQNWKNAPKDAHILGLKELLDEDEPLTHKHIYFAHAFKKQDGWQKLMKRFNSGGGSLYDLEYLTDEKGKRVVAFGHWAGFVGCALAIHSWAHQITHFNDGKHVPIPPVKPFENEKKLVEFVKQELDIALAKTQKSPPKTLIMGKGGRCATGAFDFLQKSQLDSLCAQWGKEDTAKGGPFEEILEFDVFVNCVLITNKTPPFLTFETLQKPRNLSIISDVSCDPTGPYNPLPIYPSITHFANPAHIIDAGENNNPPLDLIAIDHLPSALPRESTEDFSIQLLPHLLELQQKESAVFQRAFELFEKTKNEAC